MSHSEHEHELTAAHKAPQHKNSEKTKQTASALASTLSENDSEVNYVKEYKIATVYGNVFTGPVYQFTATQAKAILPQIDKVLALATKHHILPGEADKSVEHNPVTILNQLVERKKQLQKTIDNAHEKHSGIHPSLQKVTIGVDAFFSKETRLHYKLETKKNIDAYLTAAKEVFTHAPVSSEEK